MNHILESNKFKYLLALAFSVFYFIYNFYLISIGHFHEDAYILFIYVDNFINGHGITFYPGGNHIEGATDFLWLIFLIFLGKIGLDTGTSAIILNSIGVFIITLLLTAEILKNKIQNGNLHIFLLFFAFLWLFNEPLIAAVGGFSVFLYISLVLLVFVTVSSKKYLLYTPYLSILIALFRPDGVIIGISFTLIGLFFANKEKLTSMYLFGIISGFIVGILYFLWRYNYFQNLLPLPLYVKSHGSIISGINVNFAWIRKNFYIIIPAFLLAVLHGKGKHYFILSLPVIFLFIALTTATQSQNVGFRFQAPIFIITYFILVKLIMVYFRSNKSSPFTNYLLFFFLSFMVINSYSYLKKSYNSITTFNYINKAPYLINKILPNNSIIVLTEAGRMAFWNQVGGHKIYDLVGLNTEFPAKNVIDVEYINNLNPDLIMYHHADVLNVDLMKIKNIISNFLDLSDYEIFPFSIVKQYEISPPNKLEKIKLASLVATKFLIQHFSTYDIFVVDYSQNKKYSHIFAIKKSLSLKSKFKDVLINSFKSEEKLSYYEMKDLIK